MKSKLEYYKLLIGSEIPAAEHIIQCSIPCFTVSSELKFCMHSAMLEARMESTAFTFSFILCSVKIQNLHAIARWSTLFAFSFVKSKLFFKDTTFYDTYGLCLLNI